MRAGLEHIFKPVEPVCVDSPPPRELSVVETAECHDLYLGSVINFELLIKNRDYYEDPVSSFEKVYTPIDIGEVTTPDGETVAASLWPVKFRDHGGLEKYMFYVYPYKAEGINTRRALRDALYRHKEQDLKYLGRISLMLDRRPTYEQHNLTEWELDESRKFAAVLLAILPELPGYATNERLYSA